MARMLADGVSRTLGQQVYVENLPGAAGIIGAQAAARAAPDGYTLFFANASTFTSNMFMLKSIPYDPTRDFAAVAMVSNRGPFVVSVNPDLPVKSLPELIAYGKAQPGKLSYGVDATSGYGVVVGRLLNKRGAIGMVEVPYRATGQMLQETAAGTTQVMISSFAAVVGFAQAGKVRRIAISSAQRFPGVDDLPTIGETLPGFEIDGWLVVVAPAGTPASDRRAAQPGDRSIPAAARHPAAAQRLGACDQRRQHAGDDRGIHSTRAGAMALHCAGAQSSAGMKGVGLPPHGPSRRRNRSAIGVDRKFTSLPTVAAVRRGEHNG